MKHNKNIMVGGGTQLAEEGPKIAASLVKYSIASVISLLFYIPTYLLNVPDNTLENLLPDGSCKFLFNDEEMCKNKVKCLFKDCTKLNYIELRGGGTPIIINNKKKRKINKRVKKKINKTRNIKQRGGSYFKKGADKLAHQLASAQLPSIDKRVNYVKEKAKPFIPSTKTLKKRGQGVRNLVGSASEFGRYLKKGSNKAANQLKTIIDTKFSEGSNKAANKLKTITDFSDSISNRFLKNGKRINEKLYIGNEKENENNVNKNCINKQNKTLCNLRKNEISYGTDNYENGFIYKALYGRSNTKEISNNMKKMSQIMVEVAKNNGKLFDKQLLEATLTDQLSEELLYKFLVIIYTLYMYYDDEVEKEDHSGNDDLIEDIKQEHISVAFPYKIYDQNISLDDKANCLFTHITKRKVNLEDMPELKKCFKCDKCTLLNTGMKVLDGYFSYFEKLMGGSYNQLEVLIPSLYYLLTKYAVDSKFKDYKMEKMKDLLYRNINYVDSDLINNIELKSNTQSVNTQSVNRLISKYNNTELVKKIYLNFNDEEYYYNIYGKTNFYGENYDTYSLLFLMPNLQKKSSIPNSDEEKSQSYFWKEASGDLKQVYKMIKNFDIKPMIEKLYLKKLYQEFDVLKRDLNQDNTALIKKLLKDKLKSYKDHLNDLKIKIKEDDSKTNIIIQELFEKLNENKNKEKTYKKYIESFNDNY